LKSLSGVFQSSSSAIGGTGLEERDPAKTRVREGVRLAVGDRDLVGVRVGEGDGDAAAVCVTHAFTDMETPKTSHEKT
jgi:hypothetical protein